MVDLSIEVPPSFLEGEERCGHYVSSEMKQIWAVELDLYAEFSRVCNENGVEFFACAGTALGAVRHGGFIPWDDDFDLMMTRENYERLSECADQFKHPYFFQTCYTDVGYTLGHAQLRRSDTTAVLESALGYRRAYNQGVFIDIFPFDNVPDDERMALRQARRVNRLKDLSSKMVRQSVDYPLRRHSLGAKLSHPLFVLASKFVSYRDVYARMEMEAARFSGDRTERVTNLVTFPLRFDLRRHVSDWGEPVMMGFEFMEVPMVPGWDHALSEVYGDYMKPVVGGNLHGGVRFDVGTPYDIWLDGWFNQGHDTSGCTTGGAAHA